MPNISNVFYWDIQTNNKVAFKDIDSIKTKYLIKCKEKNDKLIVEPFDETESVFKETKAWLLIAEIKKYYTNINEFKIKFKKDKDWDWHTFVKKENEDIELVGEDEEINDEEIIKPKNDKKTFMDKLKGLVGLSGTEKTVGTDGLSNINDQNEKEFSLDNFDEDDYNENDYNEDDLINGEKGKKIKEEDKLLLDYFNKKLLKKIKDPDKIQKIKEEITSYKNKEEVQQNILSYFEDMGEISEDDINKLLNLDKTSELELGSVSYNKGMGAFFKIQSIVTDGSLKTAKQMYEQIWNNLKTIYNNNKKESSTKEQKVLKQKYIFETEEANPFNLAKLAVVYARFLKNWLSAQGSINVKDSGEFRNNMTSYFPEVLTPFTILWGENGNNISCIDSKGHEAINRIKEKVNQGFDNPSISFPQSDYQPLFDSVLYFPSSDKTYKSIRLSTKGGKNGLGAQASIAGLLTYFYKINMLPQEIFTKRFWSLNASDYTNAYQDYMYVFAMKPENEFALKILSAFMLSSSKQYHRIVNNLFDIINQNGVYNKEFEEKMNLLNNNSDKRRKIPAMLKTRATRVKGLIIQDYINSHQEFKDCVLAALKYASFDFAQVNYKESGSDGDFHYNIFVQYPAIFEGDIKFEFMQGLKFHKLKFHILGSNIE